MSKSTLEIYLQWFDAHCDGLSFKDIAQKFYTSESNVKQAFNQLRKKYKAKSRVHLLRTLIKNELI